MHLSALKHANETSRRETGRRIDIPSLESFCSISPIAMVGDGGMDSNPTRGSTYRPSSLPVPASIEQVASAHRRDQQHTYLLPLSTPFNSNVKGYSTVDATATAGLNVTELFRAKTLSMLSISEASRSWGTGSANRGQM